MACRAMYTWSLSGLVGAFVDLSIAYLLLCASAIAFMASKFLGIFGLFLPCSCDGLLFAQPNTNLCFHKLCIDYPAEKVSNVQLSVRSKFPFNDSIGENDQNCNLNVRLIGDREREMIELEGGASCSSVSDARKSSNIVRISATNDVGAMNLLGARGGRLDMKGKEIMHQRPRTGFRRRRRGGFDHGKYSSIASYNPRFIASYNPRFGEVQGDHESSSSVNKGMNELSEDDKIVLGNEIGSHDDYEEAPTVKRLGQRLSNHIEINEIRGEDEQIVNNIETRGAGEAGLNRDDKSTIRLLEQALEEEHASRAALYLELEKERSAAATAADEAMAMIQRLQEEKASVEMEARQYQRMIEEKSAYDAEEMNILKEIIIRREREKHFLEKELGAYRQMINPANEQPTVNTVDIDSYTFGSPLDPTEDPVLMLRELSASIDENNGSSGASKESQFWGWRENVAIAKQDHPSGYIPFSVCSNERNEEIQDKTVPIDNNSRSSPRNTAIVETHPWSCVVAGYPENSQDRNTLSGEGKEHMTRHAEILESDVKTSHVSSCHSSLEPSGEDTTQGTKISRTSSDKDPLVHDVHVIVDQFNLCNQLKRSKEEWNPGSSTLGIHMEKDVSSEASISQSVIAIGDTPNSSTLVADGGSKRNNSDMTGRLPPIGPRGKLQHPDLQRNPLSAVDIERLKIDSEIGRLRERLRTVQEGREKLNLSVEHREKETLQLKLLEDIAHQLQEIRELTGTGKAVRQASLPLPSSKGLSKKRRSRSVSSGQLASS